MLRASRSISQVLLWVWLSFVIFPYQVKSDCQSFCYSVNPIEYQALPTTPPPGAISLTLADDIYSGVINIPFGFNFFGLNYSNLVIGSNGIISFDIAKAGTFAPAAPISSIPSPTSQALNSILFPWQDLLPPFGGQIFYYTEGIAPNRQFIVVFNQVPLYWCRNELQTQGAILYETTNCIDIVIGNKDRCNGSPFATEGIQNACGTLAFVVPGRNFSIWNTVNDSYRFCPQFISTISGPTVAVIGSSQTYSIEAIPGVTSYSWTIPCGWTIANNSGNSITVIVGDTGGTISVIASNDICNLRSQELDVITMPDQPGAILGSTVVCADSFQFYAIAPVLGATSYTWSVPLGWTIINDLGTSITVMTGDIGGTISVIANSASGSSSPRTLVAEVNTVANPCHIHGPHHVELGEKTIYSVSSKGNVTYAWSYSGKGVEIIASDNQATLKFSPCATSGILSVNTTNECGVSATCTLSISIEILPPYELKVRKVTNRFAAQTDHINILEWSPSPSPGIEFYRIYRNDKLIAEVKASHHKLEDHNRPKNKKDVYKITSIGTNGQESEPIKISIRC